jgi:hypothetical protein
MFENGMLWKVFGPKSDEVSGELGNLHNEGLNDLHSLPHNVRVVKSRRMRSVGHLDHMVDEIVVHRVLTGKPNRKCPMGRPRRRWENNIRMDIQEVGVVCGDWMELSQDRDRWLALVSR